MRAYQKLNTAITGMHNKKGEEGIRQLQALINAIMPTETKFQEILAKNKRLKAAATASRVLQDTTEDAAPRVPEGTTTAIPMVLAPAPAPPEAHHRPPAPAPSRVCHTNAIPPASATHSRPQRPSILCQTTGDGSVMRTRSQTPPPPTAAPPALPLATAPPQPRKGAAAGTQSRGTHNLVEALAASYDVTGTTSSSRCLSSRQFPRDFFHVANAVLDADSGTMFNYQQLIRNSKFR